MFEFLQRCIVSPNFFRVITLLVLGFTCLSYFFATLSGILAPFFFGAIGAYLLDKVARRLDPFMSRGISASLIMVSVVIILVVLSSTTMPYIQKEIIYIASEMHPFAERVLKRMNELFSPTSALGENYMGSAGSEKLLHNLKNQVSSYFGDIIQWSIRIIGNVLTNGVLLANALSMIILTPIILFYLLRDWPLFLKFLKNCLIGDRGQAIKKFLKKIDHMLIAYLSGQITVCFVLCVLYILGLWICGLEKFFLVGFLSGFLSFIPYLGIVTGLITSLSLAFSNFVSWSQILAIMGVYFTVALLEGNVLTPRFVGGKIGLHPVGILFAILAGGNWFGFLGVLFAVPTAAILLLLLREIKFLKQI